MPTSSTRTRCGAHSSRSSACLLEEGVRWGIFKHQGTCLCKIGKDVHWILQGLPSNRTEKDYKDCRWETAQEALDFWETVKERAIGKAEGRTP